VELECLDRTAEPIERHAEAGGRGRAVAEDRDGGAVRAGGPLQHPHRVPVRHEAVGEGEPTHTGPGDDHPHGQPFYHYHRTTTLIGK
jgi:hypothetical protein